MTASPIEALLGGLDRLDLDSLMALMAPDCRLMTADGRRAEGTDAVRALLSDFLAQLRSTAHHITAQWHEGNVWIAEVEADYELDDWLDITALPRVFVLRGGPDGLNDVRVYGAHERPLVEHGTGDRGLHLGGRWVPPL